jgi:hypothetical protein
MAIDIGHHLAWRFQGVKSCCWLTSIEMLMQHKYGSIYGRGNTSHSDEAIKAYKKNSGSHIGLHADYYNLASNNNLEDNTDRTAWTNALRKGPVLCEGKFGWSRFGWGMHVMVIAGVSRSGKLAYYNPNTFAVLPHPKDKLSYMSIARCVELSRDDNHYGGGPFWQVAEDVA